MDIRNLRTILKHLDHNGDSILLPIPFLDFRSKTMGGAGIRAVEINNLRLQGMPFDLAEVNRNDPSIRSFTNGRGTYRLGRH
ncbi:MAG: hypothetical protein XD72_2378 [Methanothrix harundinacea]|uniref:Uncharacterized protein n=1 Tax=Methanothrix harundinacea TaxID=301375 RepID=A0A124FM06_9EURY|nr:MAG: hypothetical protein XD72_2378 [Methanothrix harundinacea]